MTSPISPAEVVQSRPQEVLEAFGLDVAQGLNSRQVNRQRPKNAWNQLEGAKQRRAGASFSDRGSNLRSRGTDLLHKEVTRSPFVWGALVVCPLTLLAAVYVPGLSDALGTPRLSWRAWGLGFGASGITAGGETAG